MTCLIKFIANFFFFFQYYNFYSPTKTLQQKLAERKKGLSNTNEPIQQQTLEPYKTSNNSSSSSSSSRRNGMLTVFISNTN